jgi:hypothetical protein
MLIRFFKSNSASAFIFLPLIAIAIWAFGFMDPSIVLAKHTMPMYDILIEALSKISWLGTFIALCLIVGEAFLLNYIVNENEVLSKQSFLPALFYIIFMSNNNAMLMLHPLLPANLFLLFAIHKLLSSYRKDTAFSQAFDAGLLISIATLFYLPYIVFLPLLGISLIILRPFNWREWLISFIGVILPYLFIITYYFWNNILDYLWYDKMFYPITRAKPKLDFPDSFYFMLSIGWLLLLFSFGKLFSGIGTNSQRTKKGIILLIWFFIFSGLSLLIAPEISTKYFSALAIPSAVFCANYFLNIKKQWWGELLFLLLIVSVFFNLVVHFF